MKIDIPVLRLATPLLCCVWRVNRDLVSCKNTRAGAG